MKRFLAIALVGSVIGGPAALPVCAAWPWDCFCRHKCHVNLECKQYNAFSPYCCCGVPVDGHRPGHPLLGHSLWGHGEVSSFPGYVGEMSDIPTSSEVVWEGSGVPPHSGQPGMSTATGPTVGPGQGSTSSLPSQARPTGSSPIFHFDGQQSDSPGFLRYQPGNLWR
jgi:hypothetical protein